MLGKAFAAMLGKAFAVYVEIPRFVQEHTEKLPEFCF